MALWSRIPLIIRNSYARGQEVVMRTEAKLVSRSQERSRVDTGTMQGGWQSENFGLEGVVFNLVAHTVHNEYGTVHMSAQPMLRPAIEITRPEFEDECAGIYR